MRKFLLLTMAAGALSASAAAPTITANVNGTDYEVRTLQQRLIGPGMTYYRFRVPAFPLNINMVKVDTRNPNIQIETSLPHDLSAGTELLVEAAKRYDAKDHHAVAAQNGNFWIVSTQPYWEPYGATPHGVTVRNHILSADSREMPAWWGWDTWRCGIVGTTAENELFIDVCGTEMSMNSEKTGRCEITTCNKGFRPGQMSMYTPWFDATREFIPLKNANRGDLTMDYDSDCTEVLCSMADGETWASGRDLKFVVKEVRASKGHGKRGNYDLALVARTSDFKLADLAIGDELTVNYSWVFNRDGGEVRPDIAHAIGGNMYIMKDGQITEQNYWDTYNTMVYSRSAYGTSQDNKTLFMITIDKSTDPVYGVSNGCTTEEMCQIVKNFGVWNLLNVDAGGSAELMVDGRIINKTTEGTPRQVGNGWMIFNTAPDDDVSVDSLAFYDIDQTMPILTTYSPRVIALNKYGTILNDDYKDFTISAETELGTAFENQFEAGATPGTTEITISAPGVKSAKAQLTLTSSTPKFVLDKILTDSKHLYMVEVVNEANGKKYTVAPHLVKFTSDNPDVADVNEHGCLFAVANGTCNLNAKIADMDQTIPVTVENSETPEKELCATFADWTVKVGTGLNLGTVGESGLIPYTYNAPRGSAKVTVAYGNKALYGLPTSLIIEFTSTIPLKDVSVALRSALDKRASHTMTDPNGDYAANVRHTVEVPVTLLGDPEYVGLYPLTIGDIAFNATPNTAYKGEQSLTVHSIRAIYGDPGAVEDIIADPAAKADDVLALAPVAPGQAIAVPGLDVKAAAVYTAAGTVASNSLVAPAAPGLYLVRLTMADGSVRTGRLLVK